MKAEVEKFSAAAMSAGAARVPFSGDARVVRFRAANSDKSTSTTIDLLVKPAGDGPLRVGLFKYDVTTADIVAFRQKVSALCRAVRDGRMLDTQLQCVWPADERKLELVAAAVRGWGGDWADRDRMTPLALAKKLG